MYVYKIYGLQSSGESCQIYSLFLDKYILLICIRNSVCIFGVLVKVKRINRVIVLAIFNIYRLDYKNSCCVDIISSQK